MSKYRVPVGVVEGSGEAKAEDAVAESTWIAYYDDTSGKPYWYNTKTGVSTWTEPPDTVFEFQDHGEESKKRLSAAATYEYTGRSGKRLWSAVRSLVTMATDLKEQRLRLRDEALAELMAEEAALATFNATPDTTTKATTATTATTTKFAASSATRKRSIKFAGDGLGTNFLDTPWIEPTVADAELWQERSIFQAGKGDVCRISNHEFSKTSIGVAANFQLLVGLGVIIFVAILLSIPAMMVYSSGYGSENVWDMTSLSQLSAANAGISRNSTVSAAEASGFIRSRDLISYLDLATSVWMVLALAWVRHQLINLARQVKKETTTASDYSVLITSGIPKDVRVEELIEHFDRLYFLDKPDHLGRPTVKTLRTKMMTSAEMEVSYRGEGGDPAAGVDGHPTVLARPCRDITHNEDERFLGSWVADIVLIREEGSVLRKYKHMASLDAKVRHRRAQIKQVSPGTSYTKGADHEQAKKLTKKLHFLEYELAKGLSEIKDGRDDLPVVGAFVTFNHVVSAERCRQDYHVSWQRHHMCRCLCSGEAGLKFRGSIELKIDAAPEPSDLLHENLAEYRHKQAHRFRNARAFAIVFLCLMLSLAAILSVHVLKRLQLPQSSTTSNTERMCGDLLPVAMLSNDRSALSMNSVVSFRTKDVGSQCTTRTGHGDAVFITASGGGENSRFAARYNLSHCSKTVHSCRATTTSPANGTALPGLCPCVVPSSKKSCPFNAKLSDSDIAVCYCIQKLNSAAAELGSIAALNYLATKESHICGGYLYQSLLSQGWSAGSSMIIAFVNVVLGTVIEKLSLTMRPRTNTLRTSQVFVTLVIAQLINSIIITVFINADLDTGLVDAIGEYNDFSRAWFASTGSTIISTMVILSFSGHMLPIFQYFRFKRERTRAANSAASFVSQREMNEKFVGPAFELHFRLVETMTPVVAAVLFGTYLPALYFIAFVACVLSFWVDKFLIMRYHHRPPAMSASIPIDALEMLEVACLLRLAISAWIFGIDAIFLPASVSAEASSTVSSLVEGVDLGSLARIIKPAALPHFLVMILFFTLWLLFRVFRFTVVRWLAVFRAACVQKNRKRQQLGDGSATIDSLNVSPYTEVYSTAVKSLRNSYKIKQSNLEQGDAASMSMSSSDLMMQHLKKQEAEASANKEKNTITLTRRMSRKFSQGAVMHKVLSSEETQRGWCHTCERSNYAAPCSDLTCELEHQVRRQWLSNGKVRGVEHTRSQHQRAWEVIRLNNLHAYEMGLNDAYREISNLRDEDLVEV